MHIDVVNVSRFNPRLLYGKAHYLASPRALRVGSCEVVRIGRHPSSHKLSIDFCPASFGVPEFL